MQTSQSLARRWPEEIPDVFGADLEAFHREGDDLYRTTLKAENGDARCPLTAGLHQAVTAFMYAPGARYLARYVSDAETEVLFGRNVRDRAVALTAQFLPRGGIIRLGCRVQLVQGAAMGQFIIAGRPGWAERVRGDKRDCAEAFHTVLGMWGAGFEMPGVKASGIVRWHQHRILPLS